MYIFSDSVNSVYHKTIKDLELLGDYVKTLEFEKTLEDGTIDLRDNCKVTYKNSGLTLMQCPLFETEHRTTTGTTTVSGDGRIIVGLPISKDLCPLCRRKRLHPVAISSSGYVYCFHCIVTHIRTHGKYCPLTGLPCSEESSSLIRLYEPKS